MNMKFFLVTLLFVGCAYGVPVKYTDCGSQHGVVHMLDVSPCPKQPCTFALDANVTIKIDFTTKEASTNVAVEGSAIIDGYPQFVDFPDPNACDLGVQCPMKPGDHNVFATSMNVEMDSPLESMTFQTLLTDDNGDNIVCVAIPVVIVSNNAINPKFRPHIRPNKPDIL